MGADFRGRVTEARPEGGQEEEARAKGEVVGSLKRALTAAAEPTDQKVAKLRKAHRVPAFWWAVQLDNAFRHVGGLARFGPTSRQGPDAPKDVLDWRLLILSPDSGADGRCAMTFLDRVA